MFHDQVIDSLTNPFLLSFTKLKLMIDGKKSTKMIAPAPQKFEENRKKMITERYKIVRKLGDGANAEVKEAIDSQTRERIALKILSRTLNQRKIDRFWNEIDAMKAVSHPSILQLKEFHTDIYSFNRNGELCNKYILSMEMAENGDLFNLISQSGNLQEVFAKRLAFQLLSGLEALHAAGVCHRDIKPENLLLDINFNLKIADFGFANISDPSQNHRCYTDCGTRQYMSPEVLSVNGRGYDGNKYDIWCAGVVCFIIIMGHPPFAIAKDSDWWFHRIANHQYSIFWDAHLRKGKTKNVSVNAMKFLNRMFVANPLNRATATDLLKDPWLFF
mmetsp:Transcript_20996/g.27253  ORF Transcript_20996/g.27253 Transcript_20996/m.27253 type:complete len:331 (-) Transcript_20996:481-1473(-)